MDAKATGQLITARRKALGLSQAELAERLHVTDKAVSRWETGRGMPAIDSLEPLAEALGLSVSELLSGRELTADELPGEAGSQIVETMRKSAGMVWRGVLATLLVLALLTAPFPAYHYVVSAPETDRAALEKQAAEKQRSHPWELPGFQDSFNYDDLRITVTDRRGDYLAALCTDDAGHWCICVYGRDEIFPDRWRVNGGVFGMESGEISSWDFGDPQGTAVVAFGGGDLPEEITYYSFWLDGITYTCPVAGPGEIFNLFLVPDTYAIAPSDLTLLDEDRQPLSYEDPWIPGVGS